MATRRVNPEDDTPTVIGSVGRSILGFANPRQKVRDTLDGGAAVLRDANGAAAQAAQKLMGRKKQIDDQVERDTNGYGPTDVEYGGNVGNSIKR